MKTTPVTPADIARSVIAVPPLARDADLRLNRAANLAIIKYLEAAGIRSLMYGGNAVFFNVSIGEYAEILDFLAESVGPDTWLLPSAGPDFGKLRDQVPILKERPFPSVMVLPVTGPSVPTGVARGIRLFAEALGKSVVLYVKDDRTLTPELIGKLVEDGLVVSVKYAVVREDLFLLRILFLGDLPAKLLGGSCSIAQRLLLLRRQLVEGRLVHENDVSRLPGLQVIEVREKIPRL